MGLTKICCQIWRDSSMLPPLPLLFLDHCHCLKRAGSFLCYHYSVYSYEVFPWSICISMHSFEGSLLIHLYSPWRYAPDSWSFKKLSFGCLVNWLQLILTFIFPGTCSFNHQVLLYALVMLEWFRRLVEISQKLSSGNFWKWICHNHHLVSSYCLKIVQCMLIVLPSATFILPWYHICHAEAAGSMVSEQCLHQNTTISVLTHLYLAKSIYYWVLNQSCHSLVIPVAGIWDDYFTYLMWGVYSHGLIVTHKQ